MIKNFFTRLAGRKGGKGAIVYFAAACVLALAVFYGGSRTVGAYNNSQEVAAKVNSMREFIEEYRQKAVTVDKQKYRPVAAKDVDAVQSELMFNLKSNNIALKDFKVESAQAKKNEKIAFKAYAITVEGSYDNLMKFLNNFGAKDALTVVCSLDMHAAKDGDVAATIRYRIYFK